MPNAPSSEAAANSCVRTQFGLSRQGTLAAQHQEKARKLRAFFAAKDEVTDEMWRNVTCFDDLFKHTGVKADDAKSAMMDGEAVGAGKPDQSADQPATSEAAAEAVAVAAADAVGKGEGGGGDEAAVKAAGEWTHTYISASTYSGGKKTGQKRSHNNVYESNDIYFEARGVLSSELLQQLTETFVAVEQEAAAKEAAAAEAAAKEAAAKPATSGKKRTRNSNDAAAAAAVTAEAAKPAAAVAAKKALAAKLKQQLVKIKEDLAELEKT